MNAKWAPASVAVNKEVADFREQSVKLLGMVDEFRFNVTASVPSPERTRLRPAKKRME